MKQYANNKRRRRLGQVYAAVQRVRDDDERPRNATPSHGINHSFVSVLSWMYRGHRSLGRSERCCVSLYFTLRCPTDGYYVSLEIDRGCSFHSAQRSKRVDRSTTENYGAYQNKKLIQRHPMAAEKKVDILRRSYLVFAGFILFGLAILSRVGYLQFAEGEYWRSKADSLTLKFHTINPMRGNIYASDGSLLATSLPR